MSSDVGDLVRSIKVALCIYDSGFTFYVCIGGMRGGAIDFFLKSDKKKTFCKKYRRDRGHGPGVRELTISTNGSSLKTITGALPRSGCMIIISLTTLVTP